MIGKAGATRIAAGGALTVGLEAAGGTVGAGVANARDDWRERRGVLVTVTDGDGRWGQGEASPLPGYSTESLGEAWEALAAWRDAGPRLDPADAARELDAIVALAASIAVPSARFAAETALLDLAGRRRGLPLHRLLGTATSTVPLSILLVGDSPASVAAAARRAWDRGVRTVKFKLGAAGGFADELRRLAAVREAVGEGMAIRLDANGGFAPEELAARLASLAPYRPEMLEEPVPSAELATLAASPTGRELVTLGVPLALDESLARLPWEALAPLLERGIFRAVVLKPTLLGGFARCRELARRASALGVAVTVSHTFDGPLGLAAAAALALTLPNVVACGLAPHAGLAAWPAVTVPGLGAAAVTASDAPGLGLPFLRP